jgi:putative SOS response-associated peptidase YedK
MARWGLIPVWMKETRNRFFTNGNSGAMASSPIRFRRKALEPFAFAGIWEFTHPSGEVPFR